MDLSNIHIYNIYYLLFIIIIIIVCVEHPHKGVAHIYISSQARHKKRVT